MLDVIYVVRHGYRSTWSVDAATGDYKSDFSSPTGIPTDTALTGYGEDQAKQLAEKVVTLKPAVDAVYSSPSYRCVQTLQPAMRKLSHQQRTNKLIRIEDGLSEFYGRAPFEHPTPPTPTLLRTHFSNLDTLYNSSTPLPPSHGESLIDLHRRVANTLEAIISCLDADPSGPRTLLICTHAAVMIAIGRVLTGKVPDDLLANDFRCYTCSLSKFLRMRGQNGFVERAVPPPPPSVPHSIPMPLSLPSPGLVTPMAAQQQQYHYHYQQQQQQQIPANLPSPLPSPSTLMRDGIMVPPGPGPGPMAVDWHAGIGVRSVWDCITNADCSFLSGGEERGWRFTTDESFRHHPTDDHRDRNHVNAATQLRRPRYGASIL